MEFTGMKLTGFSEYNLFNTGKIGIQESLINDLNLQINTLNNEEVSLNGQQTEANSQSIDLSSRVEQSESALNTANANLASANAALSAASQIPVEKIQNEDGSIKIDSSKRDNAIAKAKANIAEAEREVQNAQQERDAAQAEYKNITAQIDEFQTEIDNITGEKSTVETELTTAEQELETIKKEEEQVQKEAEAANEQAGTNDSSVKSNPFASDEDNNKEPETETVTSISVEENTQLAQAAQILFNADTYSVEETEKASEYINELLTKEYDTTDESVADFYNLASNLSTISEDANETAIEQAQEELLKVSKNINIENGVAPEVANAIELAYGELGITEDEDENGNKNNTGEMLKYGGNPGEAWCVYFDNWLYGEGQNIDKSSRELFQQGYSFCNVEDLRQEAEQKGYFGYKESYNPVAGDIIVLNENGASHVGVVVNSDEQYVYTIEGNADDAVRAKKYDRNSDKYQDITGYIKMNEVHNGNSEPISFDYLSKEDFELAVKHEDTI